VPETVAGKEFAVLKESFLGGENPGAPGVERPHHSRNGQFAGRPFGFRLIELRELPPGILEIP
jgi:hypothetical protein